jgi:cation diffusion facilitator family transporter
LDFVEVAMFGWFRNIPSVEAWAAAVSLTVGISLLAVKFTAYFLTGSAAIFSDAVESIANVLASAVAVWSLGLAHVPADAEHPWGHGKAEFLSAGFEGSLILMAGFAMSLKAVYALIRPEAPEKLGFGLGLMALAMLVNGVVGLHLIRVGRKQSAMALEADGHHLISDVVTSAMACAALVAMQFTGWTWLDPVGALVIAVYIGWMGVVLLRRAGAGLMDRQDTGDEQLTRGILDEHTGPQGRLPRICGYHKLRHRHSGRYHWIDFHLLVGPGTSVRESHDTASRIEGEIEQKLGPGDATAHVEPCPGCPLCQGQTA